MKTRILLLATLVLLTASCSRTLPVEGTWTTEIAQDQDGMTISGTETFVFTPSSKRAGTFTITRNGKAVIDNIGELTFSASNPGTYAIKDDTIILVNDSTAVTSNVSFHPTSILGMFAADAIREEEESFRTDIASVNSSDTLFEVSVKEKTMTLLQNGERNTFQKKD